jgi:hypothetical protein
MIQIHTEYRSYGMSKNIKNIIVDCHEFVIFFLFPSKLKKHTQGTYSVWLVDIYIMSYDGMIRNLLSAKRINHSTIENETEKTLSNLFGCVQVVEGFGFQ